MTKLIDRAFHAHGKTGVIETRGPVVSLFLHYWQDYSGTYYELRHGMYGAALLKCFVVSSDPRMRRAK